MSTSSGWAISSRNPPKCGALAEHRAHRPDPAEPADHAPCSVGELRVPAAGLADHEQLAGDLGRGRQREGLARPSAHRLLAEHRQAGEERRGGHRVVGLGNGDVDDGLSAGPPGHVDGVRCRPGPVGPYASAAASAAARSRSAMPASSTSVDRGDGRQPGPAHAAGADDDDAQRVRRRADRPERRLMRRAPVARPLKKSPVS